MRVRDQLQPPQAIDGEPRPLPPAGRRRGRPGRVLRAALLGIAAVFFLGPALAGALGVHPGQIENRRLVGFPSVHSGWHFFDGFTNWATDHLPLRDKAVRADTAFAENVLRQPPDYGQNANAAGDAGVPVGAVGGTSAGGGQPPVTGVAIPPVVFGHDGTYFYGDDFRYACGATMTHAQVIAATNRLADIIHRAGKTFVVTVPPDKSSIETGQLPADFPGRSCTAPEKQDLWRSLDANPPTGYLDMYHRMQALAAASPVPIYRQLDSHWVPLAAATYARALAERIDPAVSSGTHLVPTGPQAAVGDLTKLLGTPRDNTFAGFAVQRDGVTPQPGTGGKIGGYGFSGQSSVSAPGGAPLIRQKVLILNDSFNTISIPQDRPFYADLTLLASQPLSMHVAALADAIRQNDVVVLEVIERAYGSGHVSLLEPGSLDALQAALGQ